MARIRQAFQSIVASVARFFRLDKLGFARAGTQAPARAQLQTVEQIVAEAQAMNIAPTAAQGAQWNWSFAVFWISTETGRRLPGGTALTVSTAAHATQAEAAALARQLFLFPTPDMPMPPHPPEEAVKVGTAMIGSVIPIPPATTQEQ